LTLSTVKHVDVLVQK